jgi:hypothetical protein
MDNTMTILQVASKGRYMKTLKKFHIYNISKNGLSD